MKESSATEEFNDVLLHSCSVNQVYDRECECDRVDYLYDLIVQTGRIGFYRTELFARLLQPQQKPIGFDPIQIFGILCCIVVESDVADRAKLHEFLMTSDYEVVKDSVSSLVRLDGIEGIIFFVRHVADRLISDFMNDGVPSVEGALSKG